MTASRTGAAAIRILLLATPLAALLEPGAFLFPLIVPRAIYFRVLVLLATALALVLFGRREIRLNARRDPVFLALSGWLLVNVVAALAGPAPWQSIYGDLERMGGVIAGAHLLLYYVLLRTFFERAHWHWYFRVAVAVAAVASIVSLVNYLGGGPRPDNRHTGVFGAYLLFHMAFAAVGALHSAGRWRTFFLLALLPILPAFLLAHNRSSLLGLAIGGVVAVFVLTRGAPAHVRRWRWGLLVLPAFLIALPVVSRMAPQLELPTRLPGVLGKFARTLHAGSTDNVRLEAWQVGIAALEARPLLGYGPENFHLVWSGHAERELFRARFDRAHNEFIDVLALTGVAGMLAYLLLWGALLLTLRRAVRLGGLSPPEAAVWAGLLTGYAVYLFFWFQEVNSSIVWTVALAYLGSRAAGAPLLAFGGRTDRLPRRVLVPAAVIAIAASLYLHAYETLRLSHVLYRARAERDSVEDVIAEYRTAFASAAPQTRHTMNGFLIFMDALSPQFEEVRGSAYHARVLHAAFADGFRFIELLQQRDPRDPSQHLTEANLSVIALRFYRDAEYYRRAVSALHEALALSPTHTPSRYQLAETYRLGGQYEAALAQLDSVRLFTAGRRGESDYFEAKVHDSRGDLRASAEALTRSVAPGYRPPAVYVDELVPKLLRAEHAVEAAGLLERMVEAGLGDVEEWPKATSLADTLAEPTRTWAARLPVVALAAGDTQTAVTAAQALARRHPSAAAAVNHFLEVMGRNGASHWPPDTSLLPAVTPRTPRPPR